MKRSFSIMRRLGLTEATYTTAERQTREMFITSVEEKFQDMKLLSSTWPNLADFMRKHHGVATSYARHFDPFSLAMEVQDFISASNIECLISGSLALGTMTQPRMTRDVDFNVNLSEKEFGRLKELFEREGHQLSHWQALKAKPGVTVLTYKGIKMDIFLNTCRATRWAHESTVTIEGRKFLSLECLAYFKLLGINPDHKRYHKDMNDLVNIVETVGFKPKDVETRLIEVFGHGSGQMRILRELIAKRDEERDCDPWWKSQLDKN